jgi:succinoglycan biosynthesis protein ExoV
MRMYFYRGVRPNFGDELNLWLWPKLLGGMLDDSSPDIFLGIGSILYDHFPATARKIVFGAGFGAYTSKPNMHDGSWDVRFVRGPQTTESLGLDPSKALTDAAILIRTQSLPRPASRVALSFMPHWESLLRGNWAQVCQTAGIQLIDPTDPVDQVLDQINASELLLTEAMHGAIVADALRVPWLPLKPIAACHRFKWLDWTRSVDVPYQPISLTPSNMHEAWIALSGRNGGGRAARALITGPIGRLTNAALVPLTAAHLLRVAKRTPFLSRDSTIERLTERAVEHLDELRRCYA